MGVIVSSFKKCTRPGFGEAYSTLLDDVPISDSQRKFINERYVRVVTDAEHSYDIVVTSFFTFRFAISIFSILCASLIMLSQSDLVVQESKPSILWIIWAFSLATAISNELIHAFKLDKKYLMDYTMVKKYYMEGYAFIAGIKQYEFTNNDYNMRYSIFCERLHMLQSKEVEEYAKLEGKQNVDIIGASSNSLPSMNTPDDSSLSDVIVKNDNIVDKVN